MRIRLGFVSNSSSSSFICCYATVTDIDKAKKYLKEMKDIEAEILTTEEALARKESWNEFGADWAGVWCEPKIEEDKDYHYLIFESCGGAGDSDHDFMEDDWCCDYDVDYSDFEKFETHFIDGVCKDNGFINIEVGYGAGRNG